MPERFKENSEFYENCENYDNCEKSQFSYIKFVAERKIVKILVVFNPGNKWS